MSKMTTNTESDVRRIFQWAAAGFVLGLASMAYLNGFAFGPIGVPIDIAAGAEVAGVTTALKLVHLMTRSP
jgi:hypothetical protein